MAPVAMPALPRATGAGATVTTWETGVYVWSVFGDRVMGIDGVGIGVGGMDCLAAVGGAVGGTGGGLVGDNVEGPIGETVEGTVGKPVGKPVGGTESGGSVSRRGASVRLGFRGKVGVDGTGVGGKVGSPGVGATVPVGAGEPYPLANTADMEAGVCE